jgi:ABC-type antimicrobial peptide transport system permease subunit
LFLVESDRSSGTGGFLYFSESTIAVIHNLSDPEVRQELGLTNALNFVQLHKAEGDDASCLNLNRVTNPQILGVDPQELEGRFSFISRTPFLSDTSPWSSLDQVLKDDIVPAIADETVIKWGLGKKVGDTIVYTDGLGSTMKLILIGGLDNSIFQGNVIISNRQFLSHFPDKGGSNIFLIDGEITNKADTEQELGTIFRDYGWEMESALQRLAEFNSIENTYLSIFLVLGALAILIGTAGLGVILARSILERKKEIALMKAVGIGQGRILRLFLNEYLLMLFSGIIIGGITSTIATMPSLLNPAKEVSLKSIWLITGILLLNGLFWILFLARNYLRDPEINTALRNE